MRPIGNKQRSRFGLGVAILLGGIALGGLAGIMLMTKMPGRSYSGPLAPLTIEELAIRERLKRDVSKLTASFGDRNLQENLAALQAAAAWVEGRLKETGLQVSEEPFTAGGNAVRNLVAEIPGTTSEILVIGAHYDSAPGTPGANDNGSGVAALLELARDFSELYRTSTPRRTLRFVAFANEEPPWFQTEEMGSLVHARRAVARGDRFFGMLSLETMGYYSDAPASQSYPPMFNFLFPDTGNFIAFVGDLQSRGFLTEVVRVFRANARFPSEAVAAPAWVPGIAWSDHWAFWQEGIPAVMVTDTAPFRYPHYHEASDIPDHLDYDRLARVVSGLARTITELIHDES